MQRSCGAILASHRAFQQRLCLHWTHAMRRKRISALMEMQKQDKSPYAGTSPERYLRFCCSPKSALQPCSRAGSGTTGPWHWREWCCFLLLQLRETEWAGHRDRVSRTHGQSDWDVQPTVTADITLPLWCKENEIPALSGLLSAKQKKGKRKEKDSRTLVIFNY